MELDKIGLIWGNKEFGVAVTNVPGINHVSVSEHVLALCCISKNIHIQYNSVQQGSWKGNWIRNSRKENGYYWTWSGW